MRRGNLIFLTRSVDVILVLIKVNSHIELLIILKDNIQIKHNVFLQWRNYEPGPRMTSFDCPSVMCLFTDNDFAWKDFAFLNRLVKHPFPLYFYSHLSKLYTSVELYRSNPTGGRVQGPTWDAFGLLNDRELHKVTGGDSGVCL